MLEFGILIILALILVADDGKATYLGKLTTNKLDPHSIFNEVGIYGSRVSPTSIFNNVGLYGSSVSPWSAFNPYSTKDSR